MVKTDELESHVARLKAAGAVLRGDIVSGPGGKQALIDDPSSNPIELFEPAS